MWLKKYDKQIDELKAKRDRCQKKAQKCAVLDGRFKEVLSWVGKKLGKTIFIYDETGTTRTCRHCHKKVEEGLHPSIRKWECLECKALHMRDENAAINGIEKPLNLLTENSGIIFLQVSCSDLVVKKRYAWRVSTSGVIVKHCVEETARDFSQRQEIKSRE